MVSRYIVERSEEPVFRWIVRDKEKAGTRWCNDGVVRFYKRLENAEELCRALNKGDSYVWKKTS